MPQYGTAIKIHPHQAQAGARATKGSGTLERLPSGKYRFRMRFPDGTSKWSETFDTQEEARRMWKTTLVVFTEKKATPIKIVTLQDWGEQWLAKRTNRNAPTDASNWKNHIATSSIAALPLSELTRAHLREWLRQLSQKYATVTMQGGKRKSSDRLLSRQMRLNCLSLLRSAMADAMEEGFMKSNPAQGLKIPMQPRIREEWTYLRMEEVTALITCNSIPEPDRLLYTVAITTGMREGEMWGLRWSDVYLEGDFPYINVCRSYDGPTKGGKVRTFPMLPIVRETLERWRATTPFNGELVWPSWKTGFMRAKGNDNGWADQKRNGTVVPGHKTLTGINRHVRFHDLRHTCATHLVLSP